MRSAFSSYSGIARLLVFVVIAGLDPAIHSSFRELPRSVDARVKFTAGPAEGRIRLPAHDKFINNGLILLAAF
jgi:hypothetical protein